MKRAVFGLFLLLILLLFSPYVMFSENSPARATFAGGCYWCMEEAFEGVGGVHSVTSGFADGVEAVDIYYDPEKISYEKLLQVFWKNIDPVDSGGQFCDRGEHYRSAIFYHDEEQRVEAELSKQQIQKILKRQVVTPVIELDLFSVADEEDQDFHKKNPARYKQYKMKCGRETRLQELWN